MPTGSGKSLTYQLAAMLRPSPTLVLSPLIALMKDQVDALPPEVAQTATFVNSSLTGGETAARLESVAAGRTRLLYAAPERLRSAAFVETLRRIGVGLVVIDEVHCVSMWGHDFRPDYLFIRHALAELGDPSVLGMTATATLSTAREIAEALRARARGGADERGSHESPLRRRGGRGNETASVCWSSGSATGATAAPSSTRAPATPASASRGRCAATASASSITTQGSSRTSAPACRTTS
jgi:hypothetical protein